MPRVTLALLVLSAPTLVFGGADAPDVRASLSEAQVESIILHAQATFWGKAVGGDGKLLVPANEAEKASLLIPHDEAVRVVNDAHAYGLAAWCELDWKPIYLQYMQVERSKSWSEKQIGFVGMLFGVTQGTMSRWIEVPCTETDMRQVSGAMKKEQRRLSSVSHVP